jgi:hypothetical protein
MKSVQNLVFYKQLEQASEVSFTCWCCRDTGIIPGYVVQKYIKESYEQTFEPAVLCSNCFAGSHYPVGSVLPTTPQQCLTIHQAELTKASLPRKVPIFNGKTANTLNVKALPTLQDELKRYRFWLTDTVLQKEAIKWAEGRDDVEIIREEGQQKKVIDFQEISKEKVNQGGN